MRSTDLHQILVDKTQATGGFYRSAEYRLSLLFYMPSEEELERFVKASVRKATERMSEFMNRVPPEHEGYLLGNSDSPIRLAINRVIQIGANLNGDGKSDPALHNTRVTVLEMIDDEVFRLQEELKAIRTAGARKLDRMPERLQKNRQLAEQALCRHLRESEQDEDEWLKEASGHIDEVIQQPIGQRDPFSWLIYGWIQQRRDRRDLMQHGFLQATLAGSADRDEVFAEANRILAHIQAETNAFEAAHQTLSKIPPELASPCQMIDLFRCSVMTQRVDEARQILSEGLGRWPLGLIGLFQESEVLSRATSWRPALEIAANQLVDDSRNSVVQWKNTHEQAIHQLKDLEPSLEMPSEATAKLNSFTTASERPDFFEAVLVKNEAVRAQHETRVQARQVASSFAKRIQLKMANAVEEAEQIKAWRDQIVDQLVMTRGHREAEVRHDLGIGHADERAQTGCLFSMGFGCLGSAMYFVACFLSAGIAMSAGPNTGTGKLIMAMIALPPVLGILAMIVDSFRRMLAETEFQRERTKLSSEQERAIAEVDAVYKEKLPPVMKRIDEARSELERAESFIRSMSAQPQQAANSDQAA